MNCLNKHSAQLEEVWLGRSRFYIYMEVTSYTNWKTRVSLHFSWKDDKWVPAAFLKTDLQRALWNRKQQPHWTTVPKPPLQHARSPAGATAEPRDGNTRRKDRQPPPTQRRGAVPSRKARGLHPRDAPSLPPTPRERNRSLEAPRTFFWPCNTL